MRIVVDPPMSQWRPGGRDAPILATGHQAALWHPGILAKDIAMRVAAERLGAAGTVHLVVNHDVHEATTLALPVRRGDRLEVERVTLGPQRHDVPTGFQPALEPGTMRAALIGARDRLGDALRADLEPLLGAIERVGAQPNLAAQMSRITAELMRPYAGEPALLDATDLLRESMPRLRPRLLGDARRCAACYNAAVAAHPQAGVTPLIEERDRVELPLWRVRWRQPRQRVYADLADSREALLVEEDGTPIDESSEALAPRALMLTALARSAYGLFIHGTGGGVYDRVMEQWWQAWTGGDGGAGGSGGGGDPGGLAPMAVVTADVPLDFDAPVADRGELTRAVWYRHHLPHNIDRALNVDGPAAAEKRTLLAHMDDDRDKPRRSAGFKRLHRLNGRLVTEHPRALRDADDRLERARVGIRNAAIAHKRDWCFALYPPEKLHALRRAVEQSAG